MGVTRLLSLEDIPWFRPIARQWLFCTLLFDVLWFLQHLAHGPQLFGRIYRHGWWLSYPELVVHGVIASAFLLELYGRLYLRISSWFLWYGYRLLFWISYAGWLFYWTDVWYSNFR
jgi:hypothetical protein